MVVLGALVAMFIIFLVYIYSPIKIYGRDLSHPREAFNVRMQYAADAKRVGLNKSYAESRKNSDYQTMIKDFKEGRNYSGTGPSGGLYTEDPSLIYSAFGVSL
jgi:hypothetical protein